MNVLFVNFIQFPELFVFILQLSNSILQHLYINFGSFLHLLLFFPVCYLPLLFDMLVFVLRHFLVTPVTTEIVVCIRFYI